MALLNVMGTISVDGFGGLYIVDGGNFRLRRVSASGNITTITGTGDASSPVEGPAVSSPILSVYGVTVNSAGILHIADSDGLQTIDASGSLHFALSGGAVPHIVITPKDTIYLAAFSTVERLESDGSRTTVAGVDSGDPGDGGPAALATFFVDVLAADRIGNLYVLDTNAHRVRKFLPGGVITTVAGTGIRDFTGDGGPGNLAALNNPSGIAVDMAGSLYISDTFNHRIRKVTADGTITTFAGQTDSTDGGDGGPAIQAYLSFPTNLAVSCTALYIAESDHVRSINLSAPLIAQDVTASSSQGDTFTISGCNLSPVLGGNANVTLNGIPVPLLSVGPTQITGRIPGGIQRGKAMLIVSSVNGSANSVITVN